MLFIQPAVMAATDGRFLRCVLPFVAFLYCGGLFVINRALEKKSGFKTPWRGSLMAAMGLLAGMGLMIFGG